MVPEADIMVQAASVFCGDVMAVEYAPPLIHFREPHISVSELSVEGLWKDACGNIHAHNRQNIAVEMLDILASLLDSSGDFVGSIEEKI